MNPVNLKALRTLVLTFQIAMNRFESTTQADSPEGKKNEQAAEDAYNELHMALDPQTIEGLIERAERYEEAQRPRILRVSNA